MLEATGLTKPKAKVVLLPGLLCAGIGFLVALAFHSWTGVGMSLTISDVPSLARLTVTEFLWAIGFGIGAAALGASIQRLALLVRPRVEQRLMVMMPLAGLGIGALAFFYSQITGNGTADVLFSGEESLPRLVQSAGSFTVEALALLIVCKGLAYSIALGSFRGGPVFPAIFIGGAAGILFSHLPGLPVTAGIAMGMGAMASVMLRMPLTAVLLASLLLGPEGIVAMPVVIVAVVVAFVFAERLQPTREESESH
jgi:H+/Cl- antiporter ClcA